MSRMRFIFTSLLATAMVLTVSGTASAQPKAAPKPKPGICAPWHRCIAEALIVAVVGYVLFTMAMYAYQRRGFNAVEHKQGNPDGVPVKRPE
ncbi:MAG: hypothetical protein ABR552_03925 [Actinomycetota bacterium]